jgi:hypothetical protein
MKMLYMFLLSKAKILQGKTPEKKSFKEGAFLCVEEDTFREVEVYPEELYSLARSDDEEKLSYDMTLR